MRKAVCIIGLVLELALVAGVFVLNHFARAKLGMNRWLGYHNQKWEAAVPIGAIQVAVAVVLVVLLVWAVVAFAKGGTRRAPVLVSIVVAGALVAAYAWFSASFSPADFRACYLMSACLALAALLQAAQALALARAGAKAPGGSVVRGRHVRGAR